MIRKLSFISALTAICLGWALALATVQPAGAVPYGKKAIYAGAGLAYYGWFCSNQNGDIIYPTEEWDAIHSGWVDKLFLYNHADGSVTQVPGCTSADSWTAINDQGQIVWDAYDKISQHTRIYLYRNGVTTPISPDNCDSEQPCLNNLGQVAYLVDSGYFPKYVYFYNGNTSVPVTTSPDDVGGPIVNDKGQIAWYGSNHTLFFWDGSTIRQLTSDYSQWLRLNQDGWATWATNSGLYLYKGGDPATNTVQLSNVAGCVPWFGASGQVTWTQPVQGYGTTVLYQYLNGVTSTVSVHGPVYYYDVNHKGQIVYAGSDRTIYLYNTDGVTTQISPTGGYYYPIINDSGQIVYCSTNDTVDNSLDSVYVYNRGITKLDDPQTQAARNYDRNLRLFNRGQVAWLEWANNFPEMKIWVAWPAPTTNAALNLLLN